MAVERELDPELAALVRRRIAAFVNRRASSQMEHHEVCDFCSHGFEHAVRAFHKWDPTRGVPLEAYMVWHGCNQVMNAFNRWSLHKRYFIDESTGPKRWAAHDHSTPIPLQQTLKKELRVAMHTLPEEYESLLRAHYWQDHSLWEVCRRTGQKRYDVDKNHHLALKVLRNQLTM